MTASYKNCNANIVKHIDDLWKEFHTDISAILHYKSVLESKTEKEEKDKQPKWKKQSRHFYKCRFSLHYFRTGHSGGQVFACPLNGCWGFF